MNEKVKGTLLTVLAAVLFSTAGICVKLVTWDNLALVAGRSFFTGVSVFLYFKLTGKPIVINKAVLVCGAVLSALTTSFVLATKMTSAANAIVLQYTEPVFVIFLVWVVYRIKPVKQEIAVIIAAFIGIICFFFDKLTPGGYIGNIIAVFSGFLFALVFMAKRMDGADYPSSVFVSAVINFVVGFYQIPSQTDFRPVTIIMMMLYGVLPCTLGYIALNAGLDKVSLVTGSVICMLEPILNPIWVAIFYGERITLMSFVGSVILLSAATVYSIWQVKKDAPQ